MLLLGFILILIAAAVIAYMLLATAGEAPVNIDYGILNIDLPPLWLFLSGVFTLAVAALGFWLVGAGARAKSRQAREVRELRKQAKARERATDRSVGADRLGTRDAGSVPSHGPRTTGTTDTGPTADRSRLDLDR